MLPFAAFYTYSLQEGHSLVCKFQNFNREILQTQQQAASQRLS